QTALARALGQLVFQKGLSLDALYKKLVEYDKRGGFEMESPSSLWYMVLYDPNKERVLTRGEDLAARLLVYLLGGGIEDDSIREKLRTDLAKERSIEGLATNFNGNRVKPEEIMLPPAL